MSVFAEPLAQVREAFEYTLGKSVVSAKNKAEAKRHFDAALDLIEQRAKEMEDKAHERAKRASAITADAYQARVQRAEQRATELQAELATATTTMELAIRQLEAAEQRATDMEKALERIGRGVCSNAMAGFEECDRQRTFDDFCPVCRARAVLSAREETSGSGSSAADVDVAGKHPSGAASGHHESVGERQGRQPDPEELRAVIIELARWSQVATRNGDLHARVASALALSAREEAQDTIVSYEFDGEGRAYSRHANGEVLPTGYVARSFAGKSDVTPQRLREIRGEEAQT